MSVCQPDARCTHASRAERRTLNQFPPYQTLAIIWTGPLSFLRTHGPVRNVKRARTASGTRAGRLGALRTFVLGHHNCAFSLANFGQLARIRPIFINLLRGSYEVHSCLALANPRRLTIGRGRLHYCGCRLKTVHSGKWEVTTAADITATAVG